MHVLYKLVGHDAVPVEDDADRVEADRQIRTRVALDYPIKGVKVSTVFLAVNHSHSWDGPPILFETMVFGGVLHHEQVRYATWNEAEKGHAAMVARVIAGEHLSQQSD